MAVGQTQEQTGQEVHEAGKHATGRDDPRDQPSSAPESGQPDGGREATRRVPAGSSGEDF